MVKPSKKSQYSICFQLSSGKCVCSRLFALIVELPTFKMSAESLWELDFTKLLTEITPIPEDVFSLLHEVANIAPTDENELVKNPGQHAMTEDSVPGPSKKCRFASPLSEKQIEEFCQPSIPKNTQRNTSGVVSVFKEWCNYRNKDPHTTKRCPEDLLQTSYPTTVVDYWLAMFVLEARRKYGDFYPGNTLQNLLAALFQTMKGNLSPLNVVNFIDKSQREAHYPHLHNAHDNKLKMLKSCGVGIERNRAIKITIEVKN